MKLEDIEHAKLRALAQIVMDKDKGVEAFDDYMKKAFPYLESMKNKEKSDHIQALERWVKSGPMKITPLTTPSMKSRMKSRAASGPKSKVDAKKADALYSKLGSTLPI